jgi:hypothetical protein
LKKTAALFLVLVSLTAVLSAEEKRMAPLDFPSTAANGMGGSHVAYTGDIFSLFVNPAALQWANQGSIFDLSPAIIGPLDKFAKSGSKLTDSIKSMQEGFGGESGGANPFGPLLDIINGGKLPLGVDLKGPLSAGYTANGLGAGLFSRVFVEGRIIGTDVDAVVNGDVMLPFGISFNILRLKDHELAGGVTLKPFVRVRSDIELSALDIIDNTDVLADIPVSMLVGLGSDLGFLYRFKRDLTAGLTVGDVYTFGAKAADFNGTSGDDIYRVPLSLNVGAAYVFRPANFWPQAVPEILQSSYAAVMLDWHNANNIFKWNDRLHRNPILDLGMGAEFGFFNFLKLRVGLHDMLPMIGFGLEPRVFKFNIALYGKELGSEPGINSTMALDISVALRLDTKRREWPWSKPLVNLNN